MHAPVSLTAISRGLAVLCEKPLATSLADARRMREAARRHGALTMVNFSYRNAAGAQAAADLVRGGGIGRVLHVQASYLQSWLAQDRWGDWRTDPQWPWRLSRAHGGGVLEDVGCHIYDLAAFICGEITEVSCRLATFDKGVGSGRIGGYRLDANDSFVSTVVFAGGGIGTVQASRWATGQINSVRVRVHGDSGAVDVDLDRGADRYWLSRGPRALRAGLWREVRARPVPTQYQRFIRLVRRGGEDPSDFANGARVQEYIQASLLSDTERRPVKVRAPR
jgi:predicted dehydrogenase